MSTVTNDNKVCCLASAPPKKKKKEKKDTPSSLIYIVSTCPVSQHFGHNEVG